MGDEKKKAHPLFPDMSGVLKGVTNVVSGRIFDTKTWSASDLDDAPPAPPQPPVNDDAEEIEEVRTTRRRKGGTFAPAVKKPAEGSGAGGTGGGGEPKPSAGTPTPEGTPAGK